MYIEDVSKGTTNNFIPLLGVEISSNLIPTKPKGEF